MKPLSRYTPKTLMLENESVFCLDPSCFTSLENLTDTLKVLREIKDIRGSFELYIPSQVFDIVILPPEQKFNKLPFVLKPWLNSSLNITNLRQQEKKKYKEIMQTILGPEFRAVSPKDRIKKITQIGEHTIYLDDVIAVLGETGKIVFDMLAISVLEYGTMIAFNKETANMVQSIGSIIMEKRSKLKQKIKSKKGIKSALSFMRMFMTSLTLQNFLITFGVETTIITDMGNFGTFWVLNG